MSALVALVIACLLPHSRISASTSTVTVTAGPDTDAANNDYRRIQNAINAANPGDTIVLSGTFDFTQPFAAAAWALGNDNIAATADDFEVLVPANVNGVTVTATALGSATIQGPGDLAAWNLEAFLVFDRSAGTAVNQNWTISNLRILDFDLSIAFFKGAVDAFLGTTVQNNLIRIPTDLNATVAPVDVNQNIGIHYSFGKNQSFLDNTFEIPGNGVSDGSNLSATVGMQSETSGFDSYDGLTIANNVVHVLNGQSANPERIYGIWENSFATSANIQVSNNSFLNDAPGNDPALNLQKAFRITSHSSPTTTVTYASNTVNGASIGMEWIAGLNFSGLQAVVLDGNTITNSKTGVLVQSNGVAHLENNVITGSGAGGGVHVLTGTLTGVNTNPISIYRNTISGGTGDGIWIEATAGAVDPVSQNDLGGNAGFGLRNDTAPAIVADRNWWGNNLAANVAAKVSGNVASDPWLASGTDVNAAQGFQPFSYATTSGTLTTFSGTASDDAGALLAGDPVTMTMNGDSAVVPLAQLLNVSIQLGDSDDVFTLGQTGVPTVIDGGNGNDTLVGTNVAQSWNITGAGSGNLPGATSSFSNVEAVRGGTAADTFVFGAAGSLALSLDGGLGADSLDNSAIPAATVASNGSGTLDGFKGTATGIGTTFDNINVLASPADLAVVKNGPASAVVGSVISYTITVMNAGPSAAIAASLSDALPAGTTFASIVAPGGWSCTTPAVDANGTVACSSASMPASGTSIFTVNVNAPATAASLSNTAIVGSVNADPAAGDNTSTANTTVVDSADVTITKSAPASVIAGQNIVYTIVVTNNGPSPAAAVTVTDPGPAGLTFVSNSGACATAFPCSLGTLTNGQSATITSTFATSGSTPASVGNTATVSSTTGDPVAGNNSSIASTTVTASADLAVTMTAPASVTAGQNVAYAITVTNNGPSTAAVVSVSDALPTGTGFVSATPSQGSCAGTSTVTCSLGSMSSGATATVALVVSTTGATPAPIANTASVSTTTSDPASANNTVTASTAFGCPALTVTPTVLRSPLVGAPYSQTFTLTGGTAPATFTLTGPLPNGLSFFGAVLSGMATERGAFPITLNAMDGAGCQASIPFTLAVSRERALAVGNGSGSLVRTFGVHSATARTERSAYDPGFTGGVSVAQGDTNGDGFADLVTGAGPGASPLVRVFDGFTGALRLSFLAYDPALASGIEVAAGDVNGDGVADIITVPGYGGPPVVRIFDGLTGAGIRQFFAMSPTWTFGLHVATGDMNGDGFADIIIGSGPFGPPLVQVFDGLSGAGVGQFLAYDSGFMGGVYVASGDVNGDGFADIVTGAGAGGGPHVRVFDNLTGHQIAGPLGGFFAYGPAFTGGVRVAAGDFDGDGFAEVITGAGPGGGPHLRVWDGATAVEIYGLFAFDPSSASGLFVAGPPAAGQMRIDVAGASSNSVRVAGWALEGTSTAGTGIDAIHAWAYPVAGGAPIFVGAASAPVARPDVAAVFGGEFLLSGFDFSGSLPSGTYDVVVYVRNARSLVFDQRRLVRVTVP